MNPFMKKLIKEVGETPIDVNITDLKEVADGEEVIGKITEDFTKNLMAARNKFLAQIETITSSRPSEENTEKISSAMERVEILEKLLWASVYEEVSGASRHNAIGIRKGWQVVAVKKEPRCSLGGAIGHIGIIVL